MIPDVDAPVRRDHVQQKDKGRSTSALGLFFFSVCGLKPYRNGLIVMMVCPLESGPP
jgi:hypothetical protein